MRRAGSSRTVSAFAPALRAHLGVVPRSRHEALSRRRSRALRVVGRGGRARQQPVENCSAVDGPIITQKESRLTISPILRLVAGRRPSQITAAPWLLQRALREAVTKSRQNPWSKQDIRRQFRPILLGK